MPNHIHLIWQLLEMNGKEKPHTSFFKFTTHVFKKYLKLNKPQQLQLYAVDAINKDPIAIGYEFWQRDSLPFESDSYRMLNKETLLQKMDYIHNNPNAEYWKLCKEPADYYYSLAIFYETSIDDPMAIGFAFLIHIGDVI